MALQIKKATKKATFSRIAIYGPSGGGKTFTMLRLLSTFAQRLYELGEIKNPRVAVIDSETGSASKYADRFDFDVIEISTVDEKGNVITPDITTYLEALELCKVNGYEVVGIDSSTHAWKELLKENDKIAVQKFKGNSWSAWSISTPKQDEFIRTILRYPGHIVTTMRAKTEWETQDNNGKKSYTRVGLAPIQGKEIEYEFDLLMNIDVNHTAIIEKDRTGKYQDFAIDKPGESFALDLIDWIMDGERVPYKGSKEELLSMGKSLNLTGEDIKSVLDEMGGFDAADWLEVVLAMRALARKKAEKPVNVTPPKKAKTEPKAKAEPKVEPKAEPSAEKGSKQDLLDIAKGLGLGGDDVKSAIEPLGGFDTANWEDMVAALHEAAKNKNGAKAPA
ncbi:MAG: ATP-binding protein [Deltaproteobacteria bacterium]|nr:ATP-binding protein [Deltaproteobacteria bacterium]